MNWQKILEEEQSKDYFKLIVETVKQDRLNTDVYPPKEQLFTTFQVCPLDKVKVIILGMDPYHQQGQAHGLAFSVNKGIKIPPSLQNIFKELKTDLNLDIPKHGCLTSWAKQGVLLLNSALTVKRGEPGSHIKIWEPFTKSIIKHLNNQNQPIVYLLFGNFAKQKRYLITNPKHTYIISVHPSPLSANQGGFFGGKYFSKANKFLSDNGLEPIDWSIPS